MKSLVKKALFRCWRIITGRRGVYCKLGKGNKICSRVFLHEKTTLGNYNYIGHGTMTLNAQIGNYCSIAADVKIGQMEHDLSCISTNTKIFGPKNGIKFFDGYKSPTIIENDVWIGGNAVIKQNVTIGTGAVIGAGSVVTKDVPPYAIVTGVPGKISRYRFNKDTIDILLKSKWWELSEKKAREKCKELQIIVDEKKYESIAY